MLTWTLEFTQLQHVVSEPLRIIGIDCATQDSKTGLALASSFAGPALAIDDATLCSRERNAANIVASWLLELSHEAFLIAVDAPLGWPADLRTLATHDAGAGLSAPADRMFSRDTDRFVQGELGQRPLEVGADRIARTAHAALTLLEQIRALAREPIPLAWSSQLSQRVEAIEVYPAATLRSRGYRHRGYKRPVQIRERTEILASLSDEISLGDPNAAISQPDVLDAIVCAIAGSDFLNDHAVAPDDLATAQKEGWIWIRRGVKSKQPASQIP